MMFLSLNISGGVSTSISNSMFSIGGVSMGVCNHSASDGGRVRLPITVKCSHRILEELKVIFSNVFTAHHALGVILNARDLYIVSVFITHEHSECFKNHSGIARTRPCKDVFALSHPSGKGRNGNRPVIQKSYGGQCPCSLHDARIRVDLCSCVSAF